MTTTAINSTDTGGANANGVSTTSVNTTGADLLVVCAAWHNGTKVEQKIIFDRLESRTDASLKKALRTLKAKLGSIVGSGSGNLHSH